MLHDLRYALRFLTRDRGFTVTAVTILALGIGANTAIFTALDTVVWKSLPVREPERLVVLESRLAPDFRRSSVHFSYPAYLHLRDHAAGFEGVAAFGTSALMLFVDGASERVEAETVSGNYFEVLGVAPAAGRLLQASDAVHRGDQPVAVLSYGYWQRRFGGDAFVIGKKIELNANPFTIVGVVGPRFSGVRIGQTPDLYVPVTMRDALHPERSRIDDWGSSFLRIFARLKSGTPPAAAAAAAQVAYRQVMETEIATLAGSWSEADRQRALARRLELLPGAGGVSSLRNMFEQPLYVLMALVGIVLLIACANVANLLLSQAAARDREFSVRLALGASRGRLVRQMLVESALLGAIASVAGLLLAWWMCEALAGFLPHWAVRTPLDLRPDLRALGFIAVIAMLSTLLFGLAPAWLTARRDVHSSLKAERSTSSGRGLLRQALVAGQLGLSLPLLVTAGLLIYTLVNLQRLDSGYERQGVLMASIEPAGHGYQGPRLANFYRDLSERAGRLPGVQAFSFALVRPFSGVRIATTPSIQGYQPRRGEAYAVYRNFVGPGFFRAVGMTIIRGRDFTWADAGDAGRVVLVNETLARRYYGTEDVLGRGIGFGPPKDVTWFEIAGVVKDARYNTLRDPAPPTAYLPALHDLAWAGGVSLILRTPGDATKLIAPLRQAVVALDARVAVFGIRTFEEEVANSLAQERMVAWLAGLFGALSLLIASVGLYGVLAYSVARRRREIGIRMALGAEPGAVRRAVLRESMRPVLAGLAAGIPASVAATRVLKTLLFEVEPRDGSTLALASACLLVSALAAAALPARRATQVEPVQVLREE